MQFKILFYSFRCLSASAIPHLVIISSTLSLSNATSVKTYATLSSGWIASDALIQPLLTTVHHFLYVRFGFWILRIAIRLTWNIYYNITNLPDYTSVKWNWFLALTTFFICFTARPSDRIVCTWFKLACSVPRRLYIGKFIVWSLKIWNWIGRYKSRKNVRLIKTQIFAGTTTPKLITTSCYLFLSPRGRSFIFKH